MKIGKEKKPRATTGKLVAIDDQSVRNRVAASGRPRTTQRVIAFQRPTLSFSDEIIFDVGGDRFAIHWSAEIEQLPPARPVAVKKLKSNGSLPKS